MLNKLCLYLYCPLNKYRYGNINHPIQTAVSNLILEIELPQQCGVDITNVRKIKSLLAILSSEVPFMVDITKLSAMAEISRVTLLTYLQYLHRAKLIHLLYTDNDSIKKLQKPDKIYMENTNLLYALKYTLEVKNITAN